MYKFSTEILSLEALLNTWTRHTLFTSSKQAGVD